MKITFVTLFPNYFDAFINESIVKKAIDKNLIEINVVDFRDYAEDKHKKVDDEVYGGGQGMLLKVEPIYKAIKDLSGKKILMTPQGKVFNQKKAYEFSKEKELVIISGRYEGFDERVINFIDEEISLGDFVLTGGELPSMVVADSVIRLIKGVIKEESHLNDSFSDGLLDYPQYTRPRSFQGLDVPEVLLNGNHAEINKWREEQKIMKTKKNRPDLLERKRNEK